MVCTAESLNEFRSFDGHFGKIHISIASLGERDRFSNPDLNEKNKSTANRSRGQKKNKTTDRSHFRDTKAEQNSLTWKCREPQSQSEAKNDVQMEIESDMATTWKEL
ncbi:hypothetical protein ElyMa_000426400 [Elysia marginata]|uniref:Uncharacterized protein n=1 Tax=Elysia marginata TaxID=1093978 RepID=A0AAV4FMH7_9GAST|nr:hypothetical protein ElyMa_000426400 [Elysia marginata]